MPIDDGYVRYCCDRQWNAHSDNKTQANYIRADDENAAASWHEVTYTDANGAPTTIVLCDECYKKYLFMKQRHDEDFKEFLYEGVKR